MFGRVVATVVCVIDVVPAVEMAAAVVLGRGLDAGIVPFPTIRDCIVKEISLPAPRYVTFNVCGVVGSRGRL